MTEVEITISNPGHGESERLEVRAVGTPSAALRSCVLRAADHYASDPAMQRLAQAIADVEVERRPPPV
jgi:hypothetical protein